MSPQVSSQFSLADQPFQTAVLSRAGSQLLSRTSYESPEKESMGGALPTRDPLAPGDGNGNNGSLFGVVLPGRIVPGSIDMPPLRLQVCNVQPQYIPRSPGPLWQPEHLTEICTHS